MFFTPSLPEGLSISESHQVGKLVARFRNAAHRAGWFFHALREFDAVFTEGSVTAAIIEAAGRADLVVMGTHGRRGPSRWWLGSVAERVVHESESVILCQRDEP